MEDDVLDTLNSFDDPQPQRPLPNAQAAFILGIFSIFPGCFCYCIGPIFGIIGLIMGYNALKEYDANPTAYSEHDYKQAKNGKTLSIVGIAIAVVVFVMGIIFNLGTLMLDNSF